MQVVHRDIKLENMVIDVSKSVKIIDFGFSIWVPKTKKLKIFCGTPSYMVFILLFMFLKSPEIVSKTEYFGEKADIWALGIVLYVILCGKFPFKGINDIDLFKKIKKGNIEFPNFLNEEIKRLI